MFLASIHNILIRISNILNTHAFGFFTLLGKSNELVDDPDGLLIRLVNFRSLEFP